VSTILARIGFAWRVLIGRVDLEGRCTLEHVPAGHVVIQADQHAALEKAAAELTFARGYISRVEEKKYVEGVKDTFGLT